MKRWILTLGIAAALAGCGTPEAPAKLATDVPADSAALPARPTVTVAPPAPTSTPFPTQPPTSAAPPTSPPTQAALPTPPPTAAPIPTEAILAAATEQIPATAAPIQLAGADPASWIAYQDDRHGFSLSYPPCMGEVFAEPAYSRPAGLYTEGYNRKTSRMITTTLNLGVGPVSPECVAQTMNILVWELEGYSYYNLFYDLTYDPASDTWLRNSGRVTEPDDSELVAGEGWQGNRIGFGDAEIMITGLAIPDEERSQVIEISFGYRFAQDGPPGQGMDAATIDRILQTLRFTP